MASSAIEMLFVKFGQDGVKAPATSMLMSCSLGYVGLTGRPRLACRGKASKACAMRSPFSALGFGLGDDVQPFIDAVGEPLGRHRSPMWPRFSIHWAFAGTS